MVRAMAQSPVWASLVRFHAAVFVPKPAVCQQSGTPVLLVSTSSDGLGTTLLVSAPALKSSTPSTPFSFRASPKLRAVAPAGAGGVVQTACAHGSAIGWRGGSPPDCPTPAAARGEGP